MSLFNRIKWKYDAEDFRRCNGKHQYYCGWAENSDWETVSKKKYYIKLAEDVAYRIQAEQKENLAYKKAMKFLESLK